MDTETAAELARTIAPPPGWWYDENKAATWEWARYNTGVEAARDHAWAQARAAYPLPGIGKELWEEDWEAAMEETIKLQAGDPDRADRDRLADEVFRRVWSEAGPRIVERRLASGTREGWGRTRNGCCNMAAAIVAEVVATQQQGVT